MISAVGLVRPPLEKLYGLLDDEQKARFNALAEDERKKAPADRPARWSRLRRCAAFDCLLAGRRDRDETAPE